MDDDWLHERAREMRREPSLFERRLWKVRILRFPNQQIESRPDEVLAVILQATEAKLVRD